MNVPKLRFNEFNDEWVEDKINALVELNPKNPSLPESFIYIDLESVSNGILLQEKIINKTDAPSRAQRQVKLNDILYQTVRPYQKNNLFIDKLSNLPYIASTGYAIMREKKIYQKFIFNKLHTDIFVNEVLDNCTGTSYPAINSNDLGNIKIYYPNNVKEQEKIGDCLSLLDKKIELQTKKIEDLKLFKLYIENSLLDPNDNINWKEIKLNDILIEGNKKPVKNTNEFKKITIKLNLNGLEFNESKREMSDRRPFYIRDENEIIIGKQNYFNGSIAIVTKEFAGCICSNAIMSFKVKKEYDLKYVYLYLSQKKYMKEREFLANGTGQKELSEKEFLNFTIKIPENKVVKNITNTISKIDEKVEFENNKLYKLQQLKKGLMQNLFV